MTHEELNHHMKTLAKKQNALTAEIVLGIQEVQQRELYLEMGYSSLFAYLTKYAGFSECVAQRNLDAARLSLEIPEVVDKIENGTINLSQITKLQQASRQLKKEGRAISKEKKQEVLQAIENTSARKSEQIIAKALEIKIHEHTKIQTQADADASVRITMTFTQEEWQPLQEALNKYSHQVPSGDIKDLMVLLTKKADTVLKKHPQQKPRTAPAAEAEASSDTATIVVNKTITPKTRTEMLKKQPCCQYREPKSGHPCQSQWQLEIDHIKPLWAGGGNEPENLQVLCRKHNAWRYRQGNGIQSCS